MAKGQRKQAQEKIVKNQFENMCGVQCTEEEIAAIFDVSVATLERWCKNEYGRGFAEVFREKRQKGKASLRRRQWQKANDGDTTMLIFLGKQYLGQADRISQSITAVSGETREVLTEIMDEIDGEYEEMYKAPQTVSV